MVTEYPMSDEKLKRTLKRETKIIKDSENEILMRNAVRTGIFKWGEGKNRRKHDISFLKYEVARKTEVGATRKAFHLYEQ